MSPHPANDWRLNVAAVVVDAAGNVLLGGNPKETRHWHFPQGGVKEDENFAQAVLRELHEETGLDADSCRIVARYGGLRYRYRKDNPKSEKWKGQEQCYFLISCNKECPKVAALKGSEFTTFSWMPRQLLTPDLFAPVKRKAIQPVLEAFFPDDKAWSLEKTATSLSPERYLLTPSQPPLSHHNPADRALFASGKEEAAAELADVAERLRQHQKDSKARVLLLLFGADGCGMRGCVRRLADALDPLATRLGRPLLAHPEPDYLWSLHETLPASGEVLLLPRSPYDALLDSPADTLARRAAHLVDFETMLAEEGITLVKAYLHVSESRFVEKECADMGEAECADAVLAWRKQAASAAALVTATHHPAAPWYIIPSDRRWYRDMVLARLLEAAL